VRLASEEAYEQIKDKIITLELEPASVIDEQALMEQLGLGRTPIREALQRLSADSLVHIVPRRGMFVTDISITDLQQIFEVRIELAGFCARLAAQRITPDLVAEMRTVLQGLDHVKPGDFKVLMEIDRSFQRVLYRASGNEILAETLDRLYDLSLRIWYLVLNRLGDVQTSIEQHRDLADALEAGDGDRAEALIQRHITQFQHWIKAVL
jgi:DNA-binding GntR family transcriptional regulator